MRIYYNPLDHRCKNVTGGVKQGEIIKLVVFCQEEEIPSDKMLFILNHDGENAQYIEMQKNAFGWSVAFEIYQPGLYFYHFKLGNERICRGKYRHAEVNEEGYSYQLTVYDKNYTTPDWFKGGIMYQIFPDRFAKIGNYPIRSDKILREDWGGVPRYRPNEYGKVLNNDFFGGNFNGVAEKLDYLSSLGVSVIYFNPIFEAYSNHRYDTGDYMKIDQLLGTKEDFESLVKKAKNKGIRVILDGVFNHTGDDSRYFNKYGNYDGIGAYQSVTSEYSSWYNFTLYPDIYESWWGIETLPSVNESSEGYQNFMFGEDGILKTWLRCGIGGYRLDVADELPDFFLKKLRTAVKDENPEAIIIGEVWEDASNKIAYNTRREYLQGFELDSVMNYPLKDAIIDFVLSKNNVQIRETVAMLIDNYPKCTLDSLMNILGTHDTSRILTVLGGKICHSKDEMSITFLNDEEKSRAIERLKIAALLQFTLPGVPCIYYGDENAMEGYTDPFCRRCYDWDYQNIDLIDYYRKLGSIRKNRLFDVLKDGEYRELSQSEDIYMFEREKNGKKVIVYVNFSNNGYIIPMTGNHVELLHNRKMSGCLDIPANSYGVYEVGENITSK